MTLTIELPPEIEADLAARAEAQGVTLAATYSSCSVKKCVFLRAPFFRRRSGPQVGVNQ